MAKPALVESDIRIGERLIVDLERRGIVASFAGWMLNSETKEYDLVISSNGIIRNGTARYYRIIASILRTSPEYSRLSISDIMLMPLQRSFLKAIASVTVPNEHFDGTSELRNVSTGSMFIEHAIIFRIAV